MLPAGGVRPAPGRRRSLGSAAGPQARPGCWPPAPRDRRHANRIPATARRRRPHAAPPGRRSARHVPTRRSRPGRGRQHVAVSTVPCTIRWPPLRPVHWRRHRRPRQRPPALSAERPRVSGAVVWPVPPPAPQAPRHRRSSRIRPWSLASGTSRVPHEPTRTAAHRAAPRAPRPPDHGPARPPLRPLRRRRRGLAGGRCAPRRAHWTHRPRGTNTSLLAAQSVACPAWQTAEPPAG